MTGSPTSHADHAWRLPSTLLPSGERRDLWITAAGRLVDREPMNIVGVSPQPLPGRFALPGLVDAHIHVTIREGAPATQAQAEETLRALPRTGITIVRDMGSPGSITLRILPAPDRPTLIAAGRFFAPTDSEFAPYHEPVTPETLITEAIREIRAGATWVKVTADWHREGPLSWEPALLARLVQAAHENGARVAAHAQWEGAGQVVAAGVDSIEHGFMLDAAAVDLLARDGRSWTPTLIAVSRALPADTSPQARDLWAGIRDNIRALLPRAAAQGVRILAGTDNDGTLLDEIRLLIDYGLTPVQALDAATTGARTFLGQSSFGAGELADVVTFTDDPREDPAVLARPAAVVMRGVRIR